MGILKLILKKLRYFDLVIYLRNNSVLFAKYYTYLSLAREAKKKSILIYTMGKVGSTTIQYSIENQVKDYSVYHIHWLNKKNLDTDERFNAKFYRRNKKYGVDINVLPNYLIRGYYLRNRINRNDLDHCKIISLTRDPVARNISAFFQNLKKFYAYDINRRLEEVSEDIVLNELIDLFINEYIGKKGINFIDSDPLTWFDEELNHVFGIDLYRYEFPKERGYAIYSKGHISTLIIRLENLNDCFEESIKEFLQEDIQINKVQNTGDKKDYSTVYKKFKRQIPIPSRYLDKLYNSKYANHFYTEVEISKFRNRWSGRSMDDRESKGIDQFSSNY